MALKSILAVASGSADDISMLSAGAKIAARWGGFLRVVPAFPDPAADYASLGVALRGSGEQAILERIAAGERPTQERLEGLVRSAVDAAVADATTLSYAVARRELAPVIAVSRAATLSDLVLFGGAAARGLLKEVFAEALVSMRATCLVVNGAIGFGAATIAWDGSDEAGRAVRAAAPLLDAATEVLIVRNTEDAGFDAERASADRVIDYLARYRIGRVRTIDVGGEPVAESILSAAAEHACELLVAGGYGRPRLAEMLLGGVTRALAKAPDAPSLLLAH